MIILKARKLKKWRKCFRNKRKWMVDDQLCILIDLRYKID